MYIQSYAEANKRSLQQTCYAIRGASEEIYRQGHLGANTSLAISGDGGKMYADGLERIGGCSQNELDDCSDISASLLKGQSAGKRICVPGLILPLARSTRADFIFPRPFV